MKKFVHQFRVGLIGGHRHLSTAQTFSSKPSDLTFDSLVGIYDTILFYLVHSKNGDELRQLQSDDISMGKRWRKMTEIMMKTHLHVILPFGFQPNPEGIKQFSEATAKLLSTANPNTDSQHIRDLQDIQRNTWGIMVKKAFDVKEIKWLDIGVARSLSLGICSNLTKPENLRQGETISKQQDLRPEEKIDLIHEEVIIPSYKKAMESLGIATDDKSYAMTCASIQVLAGMDPVVAQTMGSGLSLLMEKVPVLRGDF